MLDRTKHQGSKSSVFGKAQSSYTKHDSKSGGQQSPFWKERQTLNYREANNLCYYCGEKYDPAHAAVCTQRPKAQVNALVTNDLDMPLSEELVAQLELEESLTSEFCQPNAVSLDRENHGI